MTEEKKSGPHSTDTPLEVDAASRSGRFDMGLTPIERRRGIRLVLGVVSVGAIVAAVAIAFQIQPTTLNTSTESVPEQQDEEVLPPKQVARAPEPPSEWEGPLDFLLTFPEPNLFGKVPFFGETDLGPTLGLLVDPKVARGMPQGKQR